MYQISVRILKFKTQEIKWYVTLRNRLHIVHNSTLSTTEILDWILLTIFICRGNTNPFKINGW